MDWDLDVNSYVALNENGFAEELRPEVCPRCQAKVFQQKHAHYFRNLYLLTECLKLVVYRFYCPACGKTHSRLPSFLRPWHTMANEVQEAVLTQVDQGETLEKAAEVIGDRLSVDVKTVRRWRTFWSMVIQTKEASFVKTILNILPDMYLPIGPEKNKSVGTTFRWLSYLWRKLTDQIVSLRPIGILTALKSFSSSSAVAANLRYPTKSVRFGGFPFSVR